MIVMMRVIHRIISIQAHELLKAATIEKPRLPPYRGLETSFYYPKNRDRLGQRKHPSTQGQYRRPCWVTIDVPGEKILARQLLFTRSIPSFLQGRPWPRQHPSPRRRQRDQN